MYGTAMGAKSSAAASAAAPSTGRRDGHDARAQGQRAQHHERDHQRAIEKVVVRAQSLQKHEAGGTPGAPPLARLQVEDQLRERERDEAVRHDVEARAFVDLVGVERVQGAGRPGRDSRQAENRSQPAPPIAARRQTRARATFVPAPDCRSPTTREPGQ
jgi:hypothetical protein